MDTTIRQPIKELDSFHEWLQRKWPSWVELSPWQERVIGEILNHPWNEQNFILELIQGFVHRESPRDYLSPSEKMMMDNIREEYFGVMCEPGDP